MPGTQDLHEISAGVEKAFTRAFRSKIAFDPQMSRQTHAQWDSMHHVVFLIELEKQFAIRFDGRSAVELNSIPKIVEFLGKKSQA